MEMTETETIERLREGLKLAASRATELGRAQKHNGWGQLSFQLEKLLETAEKFCAQTPLTRQMALNMLDDKIAREVETKH